MNRTDKDLLEQEEQTMGTKTGENKKRTAGRIRNGLCTILACAAFILAQSCTNVIHELIPPSDSGIHSFSVENADRTRYRAAETDGAEIVITVPAGTDATALIPIIESGSKSTVIPVTLPYIHRAFPSADLMSLAIQMNASQKAGELGTWMLNFIRENKDFSVPPLDEPVDFTQPVMFCVIAGRGNYSLYTVTVVEERQDVPSGSDAPPPSEPDEPGIPDEPAVPPAKECEKRILSFVVNEPKQTKPSVITDGAGGGTGAVTFTLSAGADASALYPVITVSEGAGILPLTQEYLLRIFTYTELISFYAGYSTATDINAFVSAAVKRLDEDKAAAIMESDLSLPIDFSGFNSILGVPFAVVGADKTVRVYMASACADEDTAALTAFAVTKIRNPGLMGDADVSVQGGTVTITATYPVEYQNFKLIPDIVIEGDTWEITGGTLRAEAVGTSEEEAEYAAGLEKAVYLVPSDAYPVGNEYTATLTVRRGQAAAEYTLRLAYKEDPDTIRSITDFRFLKLRNPGIKATSMASISKNEDTGFISAAVMYEGDEPPYDLVADFYSPGTCTVEHVEQASGKSRNSYQYDVQILCTSKNKLFCRLYTVHVTFIKVKSAEAVLTYFSFPKHLNPDLSQSAAGLVDEASGTVYVNAKYHSPAQPSALVPEFAATGSVFVSGILQSSGYSAQDFSHSAYYSVRAQNDWSSDSRTYRISVSWERDEQSACAITSFGFSAADNPSLEKDVSARITERTGAIYALLPKDAGRSALVPRFSAQGTVTVDGAEQASGSSRQDFSGEVVYTVTSANGLYSKQYAVSVQEAGPVIYVNAAAIGRNNGTCWQDAYITLDAAFEQAQAYGDAPKQIWIAHNGGEAYAPLSDAYRASGLPLTANTTVRGGFDGTEASADDRRTKKRKIEFDVNAKEKKTITVSSDVCASQTKLHVDERKSLFTSSAKIEGEITLDGIEVEFDDSSWLDNEGFVPRLQTKLLSVESAAGYTASTSLSITSCTIRLPTLADRYILKELDITDSDLLICCYCYADDFTAKRSRFETFFTGIARWSGENAAFTHCEFLPSEHLVKNTYEQCAYIDFDSAVFTECCATWGNRQKISPYNIDNHYKSNATYTDCLLEYVPSKASNIINCKVGTEAGGYTGNIQYTIFYAYYKGLRAEGSIFQNTVIHGDSPSVSIKNCEISSSTDRILHLLKCKVDDIVISDTMLEGYGFLQKQEQYTLMTYTYKGMRMERCTVTYEGNLEDAVKIQGDSLVIEGNNQADFGRVQRNAAFFNTDTSGAITTIADSSFTIQAAILNHSGGAHGCVNITGSRFASPRAYFYTDSPATFTNNKVTAEPLAGDTGTYKYTHTVSSVILEGEGNTLSDNEFSGRLTQIKTDGKISGNAYNGFVIYNITGTSLDTSKETINITEPLYTADGKECEHKAYLSLTDGTLNADDKLPFCAVSLLNSDCTMRNVAFGDSIPYYFNPASDPINRNLPSFLATIGPVYAKTIPALFGTGYTLELCNCIINGTADISYNIATLEGCTVNAADVEAAISTSAGTLNIGKSSTINGNVKGETDTTISISQSTVNGSISDAKTITVSESTVKSIYTNMAHIYGSDVNGCVIASTVETGSMNSRRTKINCDSFTGITSTKATLSHTDFSSSSLRNGLDCNTADITDCTFTGIGCAVYGHNIDNDSKFTLTKCTFNGNNAERQYPAVEIYSNYATAKSLIINNCNFSEYILKNLGSSYIGGAAICAKAETVQIINNSKFTNCTNNRDYYAGAIYIKADTVKISNSHFTGNTATHWRGGAVFIDAKMVTLDTCDFKNNKNLESIEKQAGGGAVAISCSQNNVDAEILNCTFEGNSAEVSSKGKDVFMSAEYIKPDSDEIASTYSDCTLDTAGSSTDHTFQSLYANKVSVDSGNNLPL